MTVAISFIPPIFTDEYDGYKMRTLVNELERTLAELTRGAPLDVDDPGPDIVEFEINDLSATVTWANVPSANITQGSVTQHEAALSIASSQLTGLQLTDNSDVTTAAVTSRFALMADGAAYVGRAIVEADVSDLQAYLTSFTEVNDLTAAVTWANVPDANITQGSVTQHEAALTILESQITDGSILARVAGTETISGQWDFTRSRGAPAQYAISVVAAAPFQEFDNTGAGTDEGSWAWGALASSFVFRTTTDNDTTGTTWLTVNRTAEVVDNATFGVPILATSYGGIPEADLVNKQAAEIISAEWDFTTNPKIDAAGIDTGTFAAARVATHTGDVTGQTALTLAVAAITGKTALGSGLASTDELLLSDAGVIKRMDISVIEAYMLANLAFNNYVHPAHPGDDFSVDSGALTGANVISDIDINVTTDAEGHVTDANGVIATRALTAANIGAAPTTHNHTAAQITSGTLLVARGGTGVTSKTGTGSVVLSATPALTGNPTAPTQTVGNDSTRLATTAFVQAASGGGGGATILTVAKTADESVVNNTLQDDNHLFVTLTSGKYYQFNFRLHIDVNNSVTPDFKFRLTVPSSSTGFLQHFKTEENAPGVQTRGKAVLTGIDTITTIGANRDLIVEIIGSILAGATGTFRLTWAQGTTSAGNPTTVKKVSTLAVLEIQ